MKIKHIVDYNCFFFEGVNEGGIRQTGGAFIIMENVYVISKRSIKRATKQADSV
jgi:hypothetical protein